MSGIRTTIQTVMRIYVRRVRHLVAAARFLGRLQVGKGFVVSRDFRISPGRKFLAGDRVTIGRHFRCMANAKLGDDIMISSNVAFIGKDHKFDDPGQTVQTQGLLPPATVKMEGDNFIGFGTIVIGDVVIGHGAIVGAGSLVTKDIPPATICGGSPARVLRSRYGSRTD